MKGKGDMINKARSAIILCFGGKALRKVAKEKIVGRSRRNLIMT